VVLLRGPLWIGQRCDLDACEVRITETLVQPDKGGLLTEPPKSRAGKRTLTFPAEIAPDLRKHLERYAEPGRRGLVFIGPKGGKIRRSNSMSSGPPRAPLPEYRTRISATCAIRAARSPRPAAQLQRN
jgi:hypothetical protein